MRYRFNPDLGRCDSRPFTSNPKLKGNFMTQKHNYTIGIDDYGDVYDIVIRDNDLIIAVLSCGEGPAMHLVKAGNCFDELLEALKYQEMADADPEASRRKGYYEEAARLRKAAIAKAEGG
jgi:hypothetical protein